MQIGIVGKPNCGKSTFFKAATLMDVEIANYPFATIKPNTGVGFVKVVCAETFFDTKCNPRVGYCIDGKRFVPVDIIDVAGLVPGAHEGKGMGLEFLNDLNQADVLIHVIDVSGSTNEKGESVDKNSYNPAEDIKFLEKELDHWYMNLMKKSWDKFSRTVSQTNMDPARSIHKQFSGLGSTEDMVEDIIKQKGLLEKKPVMWTEEELFSFAQELRKKTKPMMIAANKIDVPGAQQNLERLKKEFPDYVIIGSSAETELALKEAAKKNMIKYVPGDKDFKILGELTDKQEKALEFIKQNVLIKEHGSGVQEVLNKAILEILGYMPIFPGGANKLEDKDGNRLPDCFLLPQKSTALDFAYKIHTDLGDTFIRAIDVKTKRTVGKDHELKPGDVVEIISAK